MENREKPVIFVSHIHEEKEVAIGFKTLMEDRFLGIFTVFVTSAPEDNAPGDNWLTNIETALTDCSMLVLICSPYSIGRPWLNFEAGAAWVRRIPAIPLCHSNLTPSQLPLPLKLLNGVSATNPDELSIIIPRFAKIAGSREPVIDFGPFAAKIRNFESKYLFWNRCNKAFLDLKSALGGIANETMKILRKNKPVEFQLMPAAQVAEITAAVRFLADERILSFSGPLAAAYGPTGASHLCRLIPDTRLLEILTDPNCKA